MTQHTILVPTWHICMLAYIATYESGGNLVDGMGYGLEDPKQDIFLWLSIATAQVFPKRCRYTKGDTVYPLASS